MEGTSDLMNALRIRNYPARWDSYFEPVMEEFRKHGGFFAEHKYILALHREYRLFERTLDEVLRAAAKLRDSKFHLLYALMLNYAMRNRDAFPLDFNELEPPEEDGDAELFGYALMFSIFSTIPETAKKLQKKGVPNDVYYATLAGYEDSMVAYRLRFDRLGFDLRYISWMQHYIDADMLRIGRLNFEPRSRFGGCVTIFQNHGGKYRMLVTGVKLHRDGHILGTAGYGDADGSFDADYRVTADCYEGYPVAPDGLCEKERVRLNKAEWRVVLTPSDPVISVHIPIGGKLSYALCETAYARARELFPECYPKFAFKAFVCFSWLMDPQLVNLLPADSKIISFQSKYMRFPFKSLGNGVLDFVFFSRFKTYDELPENTSLERSLKQHYLSGKYIYELGGVFF